jgi:hypothetical protein
MSWQQHEEKEQRHFSLNNGLRSNLGSCPKTSNPLQPSIHQIFGDARHTINGYGVDHCNHTAV